MRLGLRADFNGRGLRERLNIRPYGRERMGELGLCLLLDLGERKHLQPYEKRFCGSDVQLFGVELVEGSAEVRKTGM